MYSKTWPVRSPQSKRMAEGFVKTMMRGCVSWMPKPARERRYRTWPSRLTTTASRIRTAP
jgi:hypothetical protein